MPGPFTSYAPPDVYTQTLYSPAVASLLGGLRIPVLIGTSSETLCVDDLELFRGSSSTNDVPVVNEDISSQFTGANYGPVTTKYFPIVTGDGSGTVTTNPSDVTVTINGNPEGVRQVDGATGQVWLVDIPMAGDVVLISYYFHRSDTLIQDENLSFQADGVNKTFKVDYVPVVEGNGGGVTTTDVTRITVTVNGNPAVPTSLDGATGFFTFASPPAAHSTVLVTYYTNTWQDTFDILPNTGITSVERVGNGPGRLDYIQGLDYFIIDDYIYWGACYRIENKVNTPGATFFDNTQVQFTLMDNHVFMQQVGVGDGVTKAFTLLDAPTDGSGRDVLTDNPANITVYVGSSVQAALAAGPVQVLYLQGASMLVTLHTPPALGLNVYVTHYTSLLRDDCYDITCVLPGASGVGTYNIVSQVNGTLLHAYVAPLGEQHVADPNFAYEGIIWPSGPTLHGGYPDLQINPEYAVQEVVTVTMGAGGTYVVTSNNPLGTTGTGNLNQTYVDNRTGLRFTVFQGNAFGAEQPYTFTPGDYLTFNVDTTPFVTGALPNNTCPGGLLYVSNTLGVGVGDVAEMCTFDHSGHDPAIGDFYYISYCYAKTDYTPHIYTSFSEVLAAFGNLEPSNRLVLAAWLCFMNGAAAVGMSQVLYGSDGVTASLEAYEDAITALEAPIDDVIKPDVIVPITTNTEVIAAVLAHVTKMSNIRYQGERIGVYGVAVGTLPYQAQALSTSIHSNRMVQLYPDGAIMSLTDELGNSVPFQVDGSFLAAAFAGMNVSPQYDVATPMTNKQMVGFVRLNRTLTATDMDQTAAAGSTIIYNTNPVMLVRHSLTTDMTNVLTRELSITTIADYVQQVARLNLRQYIGQKYLHSLNAAISSTLAASLFLLQEAEIITDFTGIDTETDPVDPTIARVTAYYRPMFPLNWIVVTFNLRTVL